MFSDKIVDFCLVADYKMFVFKFCGFLFDLCCNGVVLQDVLSVSLKPVSFLVLCEGLSMS